MAVMRARLTSKLWAATHASHNSTIQQPCDMSILTCLAYATKVRCEPACAMTLSLTAEAEARAFAAGAARKSTTTSEGTYLVESIKVISEKGKGFVGFADAQLNYAFFESLLYFVLLYICFYLLQAVLFVRRHRCHFVQDRYSKVKAKEVFLSK